MAKKNLNPESVINELRGQSVFFRAPTTSSEVVVLNATSVTSPLSETKAEAPAPMHERADARMHKSTEAQLHERTNVQKHDGTDVQGYRTIVRRTVDLYLDQNEQIDELVLQRRKELKRHVKIGEVVREMIDFYFAQKSKG